MRHPSSIWLLSGVTGFLGKVILAELVRRREELGVREIRVIVRAKAARRGAARFREEVAASPGLAGLPQGWCDLVSVVDGDLALPDLGLADATRVLADVTHVVHSAASIAFNLPAVDAARANIEATLTLLALSRNAPSLRRFVYVSTAYVTPHPGDDVPIPEALVALPSSASALYEDITTGRVDDRTLLARTGHPNTYTLTKCVAEHLVAERRGSLPVSIVRPSIISAAARHPFPGWIDSTAGFGAFAVLVGLGHLRAIVGNPEARIDVVPVDEVADRVIDAAVQPAAPFIIRHAVTGLASAPTVAHCWDVVSDWFCRHPLQRRPRRGFLGAGGLKYRVADLWHHRLPIAVGSLGSADDRRRAGKLAGRLEHLNRVFPYFTSRSFHFRAARPVAPGQLGDAYIETICRGLYRHVLRADDREWTLAGAAQRGNGGDARWVFRQPAGNLWVRAASWLVTKVLRRVADRVTVDLPSFERARRGIAPGAALAVIPSHRSYLDFVLVSYLAFARPDLGIPIPHIAATMEFGRIPVLGRILRALHAFYLRRGRGAEDPELTQRVRALIAEGKTLEFFVEGARSRSREFLGPKRGLLRCLQATGREVGILPISISYDRVPEEAAFADELEGRPKPPMRLGALLRWLWRAWRGDVALGRMHLAAGAAVVMGPASDVPEVAARVIESLRESMAVTRFHLRQYCAVHDIPGHDAESVERLLVAKGYRVLESTLPEDPALPASIARTMAEHFRDRVPELFGQMPSSRSLAASWVRLRTPSRL